MVLEHLELGVLVKTVYIVYIVNRMFFVLYISRFSIIYCLLNYWFV